MKQRLTTTILAIALALSCVFGAAGCSASQSQEAAEGTLAASMQEMDTSDTSGGVAATVNGVEIGENAVTAYIANFRAANDLTDDDSWGTWLIDYAYTIDSMRGDTLEMFENRELIRQAAAENGIEVSESEVDAAVESERSYYDSDEEWLEALAAACMTEQGFRDQVEVSLLSQALCDKLFGSETASEEAILTYVEDYADSLDGAKRSSHILFSADDEATAQEVLDKINSGELSFEDAVEQYSTDTTTSSSGGDAGWDKVTTFATDYQAALDELAVGEVSGLVETEFGIHIIQCTEQLSIPDELTSTDQLPESFVAAIQEAADYVAVQQSYSDYMTDYRDAADIQEELLPDGMPYYIDLTPYEEAARDAAAEAEAESDSEAESTESDGTAESEGDGTAE